MQNRMAIRADRTEVSNRIDAVPSADLSEWPEVVNVNKTFHHRAIGFTEIELTDGTGRSKTVDASLPSLRASLKRVNRDPLDGTLPEGSFIIHFIGKEVQTSSFVRS